MATSAPCPLILVHSQDAAPAMRRHGQISVFRHWVENASLPMLLMESYVPLLIEPARLARYRQLRRRFIKVQNEAYLCCMAAESASGSRYDRATQRMPRLMWLMMCIRRQAERLGFDALTS